LNLATRLKIWAKQLDINIKVLETSEGGLTVMKGLPGQRQLPQRFEGRDGESSHNANGNLQIEMVARKHDHDLEQKASDRSQLFVY
jgi:hypothetical protein